METVGPVRHGALQRDARLQRPKTHHRMKTSAGCGTGAEGSARQRRCQTSAQVVGQEGRVAGHRQHMRDAGPVRREPVQRIGQSRHRATRRRIGDHGKAIGGKARDIAIGADGNRLALRREDIGDARQHGGPAHGEEGLLRAAHPAARAHRPGSAPRSASFLRGARAGGGLGLGQHLRGAPRPAARTRPPRRGSRAPCRERRGTAAPDSHR